MDEVVNPNDMQVSQLERAPGLALQVIQRRRIGQHQVRQKLQRDLPLQLFIARQPDNAHSAAPKNPNECVAAEEFLSADKLALRHVRGTAGSLAAHPARILLEETAIKPKQ